MLSSQWPSRRSPRACSYPPRRVLAWFALLAVPIVLGSSVARHCGFAAAACAGWLYLWAFSEPRFAARVTDQWAIRLAFFLAALGALGAYIGDRRREESQHR